jgi:hypothetical protein
MPEDPNSRKVRTVSLSTNSVPATDEVQATQVIDRIMGGVNPMIRGFIERSELQSAIIIISTPQGKVVMSIMDKELPPGSEIGDMTMAQVNKIAMSNMAATAATTLGTEVGNLIHSLHQKHGQG